MSCNVAFLFPGQGRIPDALPEDRAALAPLLALAADAGLQLAEWIESHAIDRLTVTDAAQPSLLLDSLSRERQLRNAGWTPMCVAGHSLGEYAALVSAGVLADCDAMKAVIERGRLMSDVKGSMTAILKLDLDAVAQLCAGTETVVANHNAVSQIVISGPAESVEEVARRAETAGARCIPLNVSGPFHSPLMQPAQDALASLLEKVDFAQPAIPVVSSVSGKAVREASALKDLLLRQMTAAVRWVDVSDTLIQLGVEIAVEVGGGDVLTRLGRRSDSPIRFLTFEEAIDERC